jgi:hypothetical protein
MYDPVFGKIGPIYFELEVAVIFDTYKPRWNFSCDFQCGLQVPNFICIHCVLLGMKPTEDRYSRNIVLLFHALWAVCFDFVHFVQRTCKKCTILWYIHTILHCCKHRVGIRKCLHSMWQMTWWKVVGIGGCNLIRSSEACNPVCVYH